MCIRLSWCCDRAHERGLSFENKSFVLHAITSYEIVCSCAPSAFEEGELGRLCRESDYKSMETSLCFRFRTTIEGLL